MIIQSNLSLLKFSSAARTENKVKIIFSKKSTIVNSMIIHSNFTLLLLCLEPNKLENSCSTIHSCTYRKQRKYNL